MNWVLSMYIANIHERKISSPVNDIGALLDTISSIEDKMWPYENWPRIKFDRPLETGAIGGHGPVRYTVASYSPGKSIKFTFTKHFDGYHEITLEKIDETVSLMRHTIKAKTTGAKTITWLLAIRPLHNALIEDLFDKVERELSCNPQPRSWGVWIRLLRRLADIATQNKRLNVKPNKSTLRSIK